MYIVLAGDECWLLNIIQTCVCVCVCVCVSESVYIVLANDECWLLNIIQTCVCVCLNLCMRVIFGTIIIIILEVLQDVLRLPGVRDGSSHAGSTVPSSMCYHNYVSELHKNNC